MIELRNVLMAAGGELAWMLGRLDAAEIADELREQVLTWVGQHLRIARGLSANTAGKYGRHVIAFLVWLTASGRCLDDVRPIDVEAWQKDLFLRHGYSAAWRANHLAGLRSFFAWREMQGAGRSPAAVVRGPRLARRVPRKYSAEQLRKLFGAVRHATPIERRDRAFLGMLYATGARRAEMVALDLDQIELQQQVARVRFIGKGAKERMVSFEGLPVRWLREWLVDRDAIRTADPAPVWIALGQHDEHQRMTLSGLDRLFRRLAGAAGIQRMSLHAMRVTYATELYDQGIDIERIRRLMGHESIETTRRYIAVTERQTSTRISSRRIAEIMGGDDGTPLWAKVKLDARG